MRGAVIPMVPGAILFDLLNGGDKKWGRYPPYRELGHAAAASASAEFALGSVGASMRSPDPSETIEFEPDRASLLRNSLGRSLLWGRKDGLPESLQGPLYPIILTEGRWRKLPSELRAAIRHYGFKRSFVDRPAQYAYEQLNEHGLPTERLAEFEQAMLAYV